MAGETLNGCGATVNNATSIATGNQTYFMDTQSGYLNAQTGSVEAEIEVTARVPGVFSKLSILVFSNSKTTDSFLRFRKNGGNGNQAVTIPASTTGWFEDSSNTDSVSSGDTFCMALTHGVSGSAFTVGACLVTFAANSGDAVTFLGHSRTNVTEPFAVTAQAGSSTRCSFTGYWPANTNTATFNNSRINSPGTIGNMQCYVRTNARTQPSTLQSRKNDADGNMLITIPATTTGLFEDTSNTDSLDGDDSMGFELTTTTGAGSEALNVSRVGYTFTSTDGSWPLNAGGNSSVIVSSASKDSGYYVRFLGRSPGAGATSMSGNETPMQLRVPFACTLQKMWINVGSMSTDGQTMRSRVNGSDGNQAIAISAGTSGYFEDSSNTDALAAGDLICGHMSDSTATSSTINNWGVSIDSIASAPANDPEGGKSFFFMQAA